MKIWIKPLIFLCLVTMLFIPTTVYAQSGDGGDTGKLVLGGTYTLNSGESLQGDLGIMGGTANLQEESTVNGNVFIAGGTLTVDGTVNGSITSFGGTLNLGDGAIVNGDVVTAGTTLHRSENAHIRGSIVQGLGNLPLNLGNPGVLNQPNVRVNFKPFSDALWFLFRTLALAALAILVTMFLPRQTGRIANAVVRKPIESIGLGLLTLVVAPLMLIILLITIILSPVSILGLLALGLSVLFGWIALGLEVGIRLEKMFHTTLPIAVSAGLGTFVLSLVGNGIAYIPCVGWLVPTMIGLFGLGGVLLTRFGTHVFPQDSPDFILPDLTAPAAPNAPQPRESTPDEILPPTPPENQDPQA